MKDSHEVRVPWDSHFVQLRVPRVKIDRQDCEARKSLELHMSACGAERSCRTTQQHRYSAAREHSVFQFALQPRNFNQ